jgi:hypothetical protein
MYENYSMNYLMDKYRINVLYTQIFLKSGNSIGSFVSFNFNLYILYIYIMYKH